MINKSKLEKTFFCKHTFVAVIIIPLAVSVVFGFVSGFAAFKVKLMEIKSLKEQFQKIRIN
jgi:hypothetical protein